MKTLYLSIIVILTVLVLLPLNVTLAQNATNSSNQTPSGAIRTSNGGWITPLQTTTENGSNLTIHYETGIPVLGNYLSPGPPPVIHMNLQANSQVYEKGDMITISGQEDDYLIKNYGNNLTLSIGNSRTGEHWCCDNFQSSYEGSFYYVFKMPDMFQSSDNYNIRINPHNSTDQYGIGILYYEIMPRPLEQIRLGISTLDVECRDNLVHVIKSEGKSPACVKQDDMDELVHRGWAQPGMVPSKRIPHIVPTPLNPINLSQPCEIPYEQKPSTTSPIYPNGTVITTGYVPVLYMPTNSTGMICVKYENSNDPKPANMQISEANNSSRKPDITTYASPDTIAKGNTTVVYTISTGKQSGFYGISLSCVGMPFAVGYDNQSRIILDDFPWMNGKTTYCPLMPYDSEISGLDRIGVYYIKTVSYDHLIYDIQNTTVTSIHAGPSSQTVTFSLHVHTFDKPIRFWLDYKDSTIAEFMTNPGFKQIANQCNWDVTHNSIIQNAPWLRLDGINVTEKPITISPYSNGTFTFSVLAKNLSDGYYGLNPVVYGDTSDTPAENAGTNYVAYNYPITIGNGIAWSLDSVGTCSR
ncbi:MAG: hypothetical protein ACYC9R_08205 [Nitrosotalea sp.]